jgi:ribosome-associated protein
MNEIDKSPDPNSKSQRKRDMTALQDLGELLTSLTGTALKKCDLPDFLFTAITEYQRLPNKHGARKRQLQYIGKLMRELPEETLVRVKTQTSEDPLGEKRRFMALEALRTRLLAGDKTALAGLLQQHPQADARQLEQLIEQARLEQGADKTPLASRKLFQLLRQLQGV